MSRAPSHAKEALVAILVSCAHNKLQKDREASSTWLREGCGIVCATAKLGSSSDQQGTPPRVVARLHPFQTIALPFAS